MALMDVFKADAFSMMSLLAAIKNVDYKPSFLGTLGLFQDAPQRTRTVAIESDDETLSLISTSQVGAPPSQLSATKRKVRNFSTVRLAKASTIKAEELQGIRAFGSETELQQVQGEVARRLMRLTNDLEVTLENHRLGAIQGIVTDADGSTLVDFYSEFSVAQDSNETIDFGTLTAGQVRPVFEAIRRDIIRSGKGLVTTETQVYALVGDTFWDNLVNHAEVRSLYLNYVAAQEALGKAMAFGKFTFAGITFINYRGTDDNSTVAIGVKQAKFFCDAPGLFQAAWGPAEFMDAVGMPGTPMLPLVLPDPSGRNAFVSVELYSYPLMVCTRPSTLRRAQCA
jgi:hypothetical protein